MQPSKFQRLSNMASRTYPPIMQRSLGLFRQRNVSTLRNKSHQLRNILKSVAESFERNVVAYHEMGHALVRLAPPGVLLAKEKLSVGEMPLVAVYEPHSSSLDTGCSVGLMDLAEQSH